MPRIHIHILRLLLTILPLCLNAQENYVRTWQYLDRSGSDSRARVSTAYFDGLGRERQQVLHGAGGDGNNIVSRTDYDARGNVGRKWLPVSSGSAFLSDRAFRKASADMYGAEEIAFSSFSYEHSGMNRPVREDGPGLDWKGHGTSVSRHRNETSGLLSCVMLKSDGDGSVSACGGYRPGILAVTVSTNPDGLQEFEFRNLADRVVLRRMVTAEGDSVADTRFIYDARGDLRCALSPEGSCLLPEEGSVDDSVLDDFGQRFSYDLWHRCVSAKAPGCGEVHYVYNRFGDVCFESTAVQRESGTWTMTKFDRHRRPAVRGLVTVPGATRESLQRLYGDSLLQEAFVPGLDSLEPYLMYTSRCGPAEFVPYMAWYYDSYDFICHGNESLKSTLETPLAPGHTQKGLCTGTAMCPDASGDIWLTAVRYDHRGLPVNSCIWDVFLQDRRLLVGNTYDFAGNLTERSEVLEVVSEAMVLERHSALTRFEYDGYGRETRSVLRVDSFPEVVLSGSVYDALGRLSVESGAVMTEYSYDIRSNLTGIQSDFFSQNAWFGSSPIPGAPVSHTGINALRSSWFDGQDAAGYYSRTELFSYDGFGRYRSSVTDDGLISETVTTDLDANVTSVRRTYNGDVIQDAALMYEGGKNTEVYDESTPYWAESVGRFPPGEYEIRYDADGRIVSDGTRQIKKNIVPPVPEPSGQD